MRMTMPTAETITSEPADDWSGWIDDRWRGFPTGSAPLPIGQVAEHGWRPQDGRMALPLLSLDLAAFEANTDVILRYLSAGGALIAPHAKTPMSVTIARRLCEQGAWGATVADARQASVLLEGGMTRLILANQIGGSGGARRLASLLWHHPLAEMHVFVDSFEGVEALADAWAAENRRGTGMPTLGLMIELGAGRAGIREDDAALALLDHILALPPETGLHLSGIAGYEGAAAVSDPVEAEIRVDRLMQRMAVLHKAVRARLGPAAPLVLTAGGSLWFDRVMALLGPVAAKDGRTRLVLRSGALFFSDHGVYGRGLAAMKRRGVGMARRIVPALRLWADVLSVPEPDLVIAGLGMRDAAGDQGLPAPLTVWRDGQEMCAADHIVVEKLNDQHAFLRYRGEGRRLAIGDVIEFGLSHPCTNLDRHRLVWGLDQDHRVRCALPTSFG